MTTGLSPSFTSPKAARQRNLARRKMRAAAKYGILTLVAIGFFLIPLWLVLVTSWKPLGEAIQLNLSLPNEWALVDNYREVFIQGRYLNAFLNSLLITSVSIAILLLVGSMGAWAFGRSQSRLLRVFYFVAILGVLMPPAIVPSVFMMRILGIEGTFAALILFTVGTRLPLVIFFMTGFVKTIPRELEDAALIDGANKMQVFWYIVLPLLRPILFTVGVILIILIWNDFFAPFFLLKGADRMTLPLSLFQLASGSMRQIAWNLVFAHLTLVSLPLIVVYLFGQHRIVKGLMGGAIKG